MRSLKVMSNFKKTESRPSTVYGIASGLTGTKTGMSAKVAILFPAFKTSMVRLKITVSNPPPAPIDGVAFLGSIWRPKISARSVGTNVLVAPESTRPKVVRLAVAVLSLTWRSGTLNARLSRG